MEGLLVRMTVNQEKLRRIPGPGLSAYLEPGEVRCPARAATLRTTREGRV